MSAIKELFDLFEKLYKSTKDKQTLNLILPIKEKIIEAKEENLKLQEENFHIQKAHQEEITKHQNKISSLEAEISTMKNKKIASLGVVGSRSRR